MFLKLDWGIIWPIVNIVVFYLLLRGHGAKKKNDLK